MKRPGLFTSVALAAVLGQTTVFAATLTSEATPAMASSIKATLYLPTELVEEFGLQAHAPALGITAPVVDPRKFKSDTVVYTLAERKTVTSLLEGMRRDLDQIDSDTTYFDRFGYGLVILDAETLRADSSYAELIGEIEDHTVLIMAIGNGAKHMLRAVGINLAEIVEDDVDSALLRTFTTKTLGLLESESGDHKSPAHMGAAQPELVEAQA